MDRCPPGAPSTRASAGCALGSEGREGVSEGGGG